MASADIPDEAPPTASALDQPILPAIPSSLGRKVLLFEFVALAEYWIAPTLFGVTNYAGVWSDIGMVLFAVFVGTLAIFVLPPLRTRLRSVVRSPRERAAFHGVWVATFVAALLLTNTFQLAAPHASSSAVQVGATTVYSPFGAWPSLTLYFPAVGLFGTLNIEIVTVLGLLAVLGSAALQLTRFRQSQTCPPGSRRRWSGPLASAAIWSPFGLVTGCAACAPLYLSVLGLVAPAAAAGGFAAVPLVPWIGLAGLLYLGSFGLALLLIRKATEPTAAVVATENEDDPDG